MSETIEFTRPDGKKAPGYYTEPAAGASAPGVVMLEEWWGVTDHIKRTADTLASRRLSRAHSRLLPRPRGGRRRRSQSPDGRPGLRRRCDARRARRSSISQIDGIEKGRRHRLLHGRRTHAPRGDARARIRRRRLVLRLSAARRRRSGLDQNSRAGPLGVARRALSDRRRRQDRSPHEPEAARRTSFIVTTPSMLSTIPINPATRAWATTKKISPNRPGAVRSSSSKRTCRKRYLLNNVPASRGALRSAPCSNPHFLSSTS